MWWVFPAYFFYNTFLLNLSTILADTGTWVEARLNVWLNIWLIDQGHEGWQYNNHLPRRRVLPLLLSITPSVFHQPVSTAWTNVNVRSQQPLRPQLSRSEGAYLRELRHPLLPPWRATCQRSHILPLPQMSPDAALSLKCSNNILSPKPTCASSTDS